MLEEIKIVEFEEKYNDDFRKISYEWLKKYSLLEPEDEKMLNNPKEVVLDNGGNIFFAKYNSEIVGTASLIRVDENIFELAKLGVIEKYQGLKIGKMLLKKCIDVAKQKGAKKMHLDTNHKLTTAIALYNKYEFKEIPFVNNKYLEADVKMELKL